MEIRRGPTCTIRLELRRAYRIRLLKRNLRAGGVEIDAGEGSIWSPRPAIATRASRSALAIAAAARLDDRAPTARRLRWREDRRTTRPTCPFHPVGSTAQGWRCPAAQTGVWQGPGSPGRDRGGCWPTVRPVTRRESWPGCR